MNEADLNALYERNKLEVFALYQKYEAEWKERWRKYQEEGGIIPTVKDRYELALGECDELIDMIRDHRRLIEYTATGKVEPTVHFAKGVVRGIVGAG
jgi:hypothetical protein